MHVYTDLYVYRSVSIYYALIEGGAGGDFARMVCASCTRARMVAAHGRAAACAICSHIEPLRLAQFVPVVHCADGGC